MDQRVAANEALNRVIQQVPHTHHFNKRQKASKEKTADTAEDKTKLEWVKQDTAIIIVHGIGNQLPLETLDMFGRGLVSEYARRFPHEITLEHCVVTKEAGSNDLWFDNVVRIKKGEGPHIDLYEYYWANYTEDKADWTDIAQWIDGVVKGATGFYHEQEKMGKRFNDKSFFFTADGRFRTWRYKIFIGMAAKAIAAINLAGESILKFICYIPLIGQFASDWLRLLLKRSSHKFANILGDICVYNVVDPKSKFYCVRRQILDGAVKAVKFLIERKNEDGARCYPSVVVAGHSLGSQVSYDAINRINLLTTRGLIEGYNSNGANISVHDADIETISDQLNGFITFGSPLDKIVFFLREKTGRDQKLRQQLIEAYHCFKQLKWSSGTIEESHLRLETCITRFLDNITWRNYFDEKDYVSGRLDYYGNVENVNCEFGARGWFAFTHSNYWTDQRMYRDIIQNVLMKKMKKRLSPQATA